MALSLKVKGILTLLGGFFLMLMTGSIFMWGAMNVYVTSYFRQKDDQGLSLSTGGAIFPVMTASLASGIPLGIKGIKLFGSARIGLTISTVIASLMVILSSYAEKFYQFAIIYGVINGVAAGSIYFVPIYMGYLYFPNNRGMVSGINTGGFALCSFFFGLLFTHFVNPDGLNQISNEDGFSYFEGPSIEVARNVPESIRKVGYIFLSISVVACQFICYHPNQIGEEEKRLKKELKQKEQEKQLVEENLIKIANDIQENQSEQNKSNNSNHGKENEDILRKSKQILAKQLKIVELEEQTLQQKIILSHNQDEQTGFAYINPMVLDGIQQNSQQNNLARDRQSSIQNYNRVIELMQHEPHDNNRLQHRNSYVTESEKVVEKIQEDLIIQEKELQEDLQNAKKKQEEIEALNKQGAPSIVAAFKQPQLYMSIFLCILCLGLGVLVNGNYKSMAKDYGFKEDSFQTLVGSLGGIANGLSRPLWATLLDRFPFKKVVSAILIIQIVVSITFQTTEVNSGFFALWVFITHMTFGGVLGILPVFSAQLNGVKVGSQIFGLYWYGFSIANLIQFFLVLSLKKQIGFNSIFYIYFAQSILALIIVTFYKFKVEWSKYYIDNTKPNKQPQAIQETEQNPIISTQS